MAAVIIGRGIQVGELERVEVMSLEDELPQWPLLKLVLVGKPVDREALEALLLVDCTPKVVKD